MGPDNTEGGTASQKQGVRAARRPQARCEGQWPPDACIVSQSFKDVLETQLLMPGS